MIRFKPGYKYVEHSRLLSAAKLYRHIATVRRWTEKES